VSPAPTYVTHWAFCRHLERLGILDPTHERCLRSDKCEAATRPHLEAVK